MSSVEKFGDIASEYLQDKNFVGFGVSHLKKKDKSTGVGCPGAKPFQRTK